MISEPSGTETAILPVLYSTGKPKAIAGSHGALSHFIPWMAQHFDFTPQDRFSVLSGLAHEPLHRDLFTALRRRCQSQKTMMRLRQSALQRVITETIQTVELDASY